MLTDSLQGVMLTGDSAMPLETFARRFLAGRTRWGAVPRSDAIINFGNIVGLLLYRVGQFQVELFIVPFSESSFTLHRHPDVDTYQFPLTGVSQLYINNELVFSNEQIELWLAGKLPSEPIHISSEDWHHGHGNTPYAFLSIQKWLNGVEPTSVGLNWEGLPSSREQMDMLLEQSQVK